MSDHEQHAPNEPVLTPASAAGGVLPARSLPTTLNAAKEAAEFVARLLEDKESEKDPESVPRPEVLGESPSSSAAGNGGATDMGSEKHESAEHSTPVHASLPKPMAGKRVLILGLGDSGLAMARWCALGGAEQIIVADTREAPPQLAALRQELPQAQFISGPMTGELVAARDLSVVYRSPGLSPRDIAPVLDAAAAVSIAARGELDLFADALQQLQMHRGYRPIVLAITGTNGKTTVTSLTTQLMAQAGKTVAMAGNIGPTLLDTLTEHLRAETLPEAWVLELSSFQLDASESFDPTAAVVLNVTQDHLDWHGSMDAYAAAKARIFGDRGVMVLNRDDAIVMSMLRPSTTTTIPTRSRQMRQQERQYLSYGADMPRRPGDFGMEEVNGMVWLVRALEADETRKRRKDDEEEIHIQRLMPADALRIRGRHNASNALAALALCASAGCALGSILYGLREYRGEPHRVEPVGIVNDVEFFDDSKGTNVGATVAALQGLGADRRVVAILGGEGKGQDFSPLAGQVARYARAVVLIGRDAALIRSALDHTGIALFDAGNMEDAVAIAHAKAHAGDAVLMSPACASFDMFRNYEHRAQVYRAAVRALALSLGTDLERLP
jgi:UDP-N-acetylmuramoylalanine--D-glutamate ligase